MILQTDPLSLPNSTESVSRTTSCTPRNYYEHIIRYETNWQRIRLVVEANILSRADATRILPGHREAAPAIAPRAPRAYTTCREIQELMAGSLTLQPL